MSVQNGSSTTSAEASPSPTVTVAPGSAWRRTSASPIGPWTGETATLVSRPTSFSPSCSGVPGSTGALSRRPRRWRLGLPR